MLFLPSFDPVPYLCLKIFVWKAFSLVSLYKKWPGFFSILCDLPIMFTKQVTKGVGGQDFS